MKKSIILIICMAVCLSLIGGAIAVSYFKTTTTGTIAADSYMALEIGGSSAANLTMSNNDTQVYNIYAQITSRSASAASEKAQLVIHVTTADTKDLSDITFGLYTDPACTTPVGVSGYTDLTVDGSGELTITVSNIDESTNYYLQLAVGDVTADELAAMEGNINIALNRQTA